MSRSDTYACALIIRDNKVLLGRRAHFRAAYPNCWDVIGGKVEAGETPQHALLRELGEEIAITPLDAKYVDQITDTHMSPDAPPTYEFYEVRAWSGAGPVINNHEHSDLEWFTLRQACDLANLAHDGYRALLGRVLQ